MNIFEDLVEELKEENLLEETFVESNQEKVAENNSAISDEVQKVLSEFSDVFADDENYMPPEIPIGETENILHNQADFAQENAVNDIKTPTDTAIPQTNETAPEFQTTPDAPPSEAEFYSKRATEEVSGLQIVEHVFSGVEREQMKVLPKPYDDLECKKALHAFLQVSQHPNSPEHAKAEFQLMQETESWYSALSHRDRNISVTHLRRYCETTRPNLSSTALISLARFYRNSPFSEQVRSKFDLILTRLFTKDVANEKRELPFNREELIKHLITLYSQWASIPLYAANEDDSEILIFALRFEDFMNEAESADSFDELIKNDFFNRLRSFKETTNENFFAPLVTATAIECNVRIGNRYIDLIQAEKQKVEKEILEDKYNFLHDQAISESASKTLQLVQLLHKKFEVPEPDIKEAEIVEKLKFDSERSVEKVRKEKNPIFKVNKWILAATILVVLVNIGLYFWMSYNSIPDTNQNAVKRVNLENSVLRDYIREARISENSFYGVVNTNWGELSLEKREEILRVIFKLSTEKGFLNVNLLDNNGRIVGYIDANGFDIK